MKIFKLTLSLLLIASFSYSQDKKKDIKTIILSRRFEFVAQSATPMRGKVINLSSGYTLKVSPDTIVSHLPYYGRAYQPPMDPATGGIKFTSTEFTYVAKERKEKGWGISIKPKDVSNSPEVYFSVFADGYASVRIILVDRQSISFRGYIRKVDGKK